MRATAFLIFIFATLMLSVSCGGGGGGDNNTGGGTTPPPAGNNIANLPANPSTDPDAWWNSSVFYEVFVRSYADATQGSKANDGIGDFRGLIERLDYLNDGDPNTNSDLGVDALWLMPMMQSPSYHGYDVVDYHNVEQDYGSNADFRAFMEAAHERGIRVILDLVLNHASSQHPWFISSRNGSTQYRDYFVWNDTNPGDTGPWGQTVWHRGGNAWYYGIFWGGMPDWNLENQEVTDYLHDVTRYWLEDMDVDGFRLDAVRYLIEENGVLSDSGPTHQWLQDYIAYYKSVKPDAMTVGEVWAESSIVASYRGEMDMNFQFDLASAILEAANNGNGSRLEAELARTWNNFDDNQFATFITNHDQDRVMSQLSGDVSKAKLAATVLLTIPGVPFIYYGEEIGMQGTKPDELIRRPLQWSGGTNAGFSAATPWIAPNSDYQSVNVAIQTSSEDSLLNLYRRLVHIRQDNPGMALGNYTPLTTSHNNLLGFLRQSREQSFVVLINVSGGTLSDWSVHLEADFDNATELLHGVDVARGNVVTTNGVEGYRPIAALEGRTGYIIRLP